LHIFFKHHRIPVDDFFPCVISLPYKNIENETVTSEKFREMKNEKYFERSIMPENDHAELRNKIESLLLPDIQTPGQYIGGEPGSIVKPAGSVAGRFCFALTSVSF